MKYIVLDLNGTETPIMFSDNLVHKDMMETVRTMKVTEGHTWSRPYRDAKCVGAGFTDANMNCYGKSESLRIESRGETDSKLLKSMC